MINKSPYFWDIFEDFSLAVQVNTLYWDKIIQKLACHVDLIHFVHNHTSLLCGCCQNVLDGWYLNWSTEPTRKDTFFYFSLLRNPCLTLRNKKTCTVFLSSSGNTSESLGEREILRKQEPLGECFHSFFEFSQTFQSVSTLSITWKKYREHVFYFV